MGLRLERFEMKKFKVEYYKVLNGRREHENLKAIVEAQNEDEAMDKIEQAYADSVFDVEFLDVKETVDTPLFKKFIFIDMPDCLTYCIPVEVIARNRAKYYAHEYDGDVIQSLIDDTIPLFLEDDYEIKDWAKNNMNWKEVEKFAVIVGKPDIDDYDYQDTWVNGEFKILER